MTTDDQLSADKRILALQSAAPALRAQLLTQLEQTQQLAQEISRSIRLEMGKGFEGYARTVMPTPLFWYPVEEVDINKSLGGPGTTGLNLDKQNLIRELAVVLPADTVVTLMQKIQV